MSPNASPETANGELAPISPGLTFISFVLKMAGYCAAAAGIVLIAVAVILAYRDKLPLLASFEIFGGWMVLVAAVFAGMFTAAIGELMTLMISIERHLRKISHNLSQNVAGQTRILLMDIEKNTARIAQRVKDEDLQ